MTEDRVPTTEPRTEALMQGTPEEAARIDRPATQAGKDLLFMLGTHETDDLNMEARILAIEAEASAEGWNRANETMRALEAEAAQGAAPLDVERLARALSILNDYKGRGVTWQAEAYGSGRLTHFGFADEIAAEYARLGSAAPQRVPCRTAWCQLPPDHQGNCEGDQ